jgi:putative tricarboxylic transport membrane protein
VSEGSDHRFGPAGILAGLWLVALGLVIAFDTARMQVPPTYARVGPQVFPYIAGVALAGAGLFFVIETMLGRATALRPENEVTDWNALAAISVGFLAQIVLIERIGFILSSACLFLAVAWGFGSRRTVRDGAIALLLSSVVYVVFTRLLNLQLPGGPFTGLL